MNKKSTTQEKFDLEKIQRFTEQQLTELGRAKMPFCFQTGKDILVGNYKIKKLGNDCWQVAINNAEILDFFTRKDAIFYCIAKHVKDYELANEIVIVDNTLGRLETDAAVFRKKYRNALEESDDFKVTVFSNRYSETIHKIHNVKQQLQKVLNKAKYIKG